MKREGNVPFWQAGLLDHARIAKEKTLKDSKRAVIDDNVFAKFNDTCKENELFSHKSNNKMTHVA